MKKKNTEINENDSGWLMTYGDMMTLILTFFVLLFSMSTLDPVKMAEMGDAMNEARGTVNEKPIASLAEIKTMLYEIIEEEDMKKEATITWDPRGVAIELKGNVSFKPGSVDLHPRMETLLDNMLPKLLNNVNDLRNIIVEGHSDNQIITGELAKKYPSNWELSSARASKVVNTIIDKSKNLAEKGTIDNRYKDGRISGRLFAAGYADQWPADLSYEDRRMGNISENIIEKYNDSEDLKSKNRRIKIIYGKQ
jgi:chemotaxis protein MotB